jgi:hypothetical protein
MIPFHHVIGGHFICRNKNQNCSRSLDTCSIIKYHEQLFYSQKVLLNAWSRKIYDIIVIGAGPAVFHTAAHFSQRGVCPAFG